jgi:hypothetical protein
MSYPNSALSAWQLALIAVVAASALAVWLVAVFLAARPDRAARASAEGSSTGSAAGGADPGQPKPAHEAGDRLAA